MPTAPRTQSSRKAPGHPKVKGATRTKTGCITCRLRRKKCDEKKTVDGFCETCVRLKLECLGFSGKRPDYLKSEAVVNQMRASIKVHLANLGMIKGHTSGPRNGEQDASYLKLSADNQHSHSGGSDSSSSGGSPHISAISISSPGRRPLLAKESFERGMASHSYLPHHLEHPSVHYGQPHTYEPGPYYSPPTSHHALLSPESPYREDLYGEDQGTNLLPPSYDASASNIVSPAWIGATAYEPGDFPSRALHSEFYGAYTAPIDDADDIISPGALVQVMGDMFQTSTFGHLYGQLADPTFAHEGAHVDQLIRLYMGEVFTLQYLLADISLRDVLQETILTNPFVRKAVLYLSSVHHAQTKAITTGDLLVDSNDLYNDLTLTLQSRSQVFSTDDAIAALHVVSAILFQGGKGQWRIWLDTACLAVKGLLAGYARPYEALMSFDEKTQYIVKTSMWFDVLASATELRTPSFMREYREMFAPPGLFGGAYVEEIEEETPPQINMMGTMGAENHIVWAMAEITDLSVWKDKAHREGRLSIPTLVNRGKQIEMHLQSRPVPACMPGSREEWRHLTSEIFRASTRVYLQSVLSGDHPHCPEIQDAVNETITSLKHVWTGQHQSRSVVRSVVFSIFITGSLTTNPVHRDYLVTRLTEQTTEISGNCAEVMALLRTVWEKHDAHPRLPVPWRRVLRDSGMPLLV